MPREIKKQRGIFERPKRSGIWWICYAGIDGRLHREKVGMRQAAINVYQLRKTQIRLGKFAPQDIKSKHKAVSLAEIIDDYIKASEAIKRKSLDDIRQRASWWKQHFGSRAANTVVKNDIEDARLSLAKNRFPSNGQKLKKGGRSTATVNRYLATLKAAYMLAIENEKIASNPFRKVKLQKENNRRVRYLTDQEEETLFAALPTEHHPLVLIALHTGMRKTEQLCLEWQDVNFGQRVITVRDSKAGKARHIPMNQVVLDTLQHLPRMISNAYVFYGALEGERLKDLPKAWEECLGKAGIADFRWHDLRHTFASRLVMCGIDLYTVKELLGHQSIEMTQRYAHLAPGHLHKAVEVLSRGKTQLAPEVAPRRKAGIGRARKLLKGMVGLEGVEPPTNGLGNRCSILLSYRPQRTYAIRKLDGAGSGVVLPLQNQA